MRNYRQRVVSSLGWNITSQIGEQAVGFTVSVILARLLTPEDFGLVGMIIVFTGFANMFSDLGLGSALVQRQELEERHYTSIFWLNVVAGFLTMCVVILVSPWIANFFDEPRLQPLTMFVSLNFLLGSLNIVQKAKLLRALNFKALALIQNVVTLAAGLAAIAMAFAGYGPFALVCQTLMATAMTVTIMWYMSSWRPQFRFDRAAVKELWGYSSNLLGANILNYWIRNADNLLIGRYSGSADLGIYTRAYSTMLLPVNQISGVLGRVMFPALSVIQDNKAKVKAIYLRSISYIALVTFPMMLGLFVVAEPFVLALFGPKWEAVIPVLQVLSLVGLIQSINSTVGWIFTSQGRTDWQFWWVLAGGILTFIAFGIGIRWGVMGVSIAYAIRVYGTTYLNYMIPGKLIDMRVWEVFKAIAGATFCSLIMAIAVWLLGGVLPPTWSQFLQLAVLVSFGGIVYLASIHLFKVPAYLELKLLILEQWQLWNKRSGLRAKPVS